MKKNKKTHIKTTKTKNHTKTTQNNEKRTKILIKISLVQKL